MIDCTAAQAAIQAGREDAKVLAHLERCTACQNALDGGAALDAPLGDAAPAAAVRARLDEALAREHGVLAWLRARPASVRVVPCMVVLSLWLAQSATAGVHRDLEAMPPARLLAVTLALLGGGSVLIGLSLRSLALRALPLAIERALLALALLLPVAAALLPELHPGGTWASHGTGAELLPLGLHCCGVGLGVSLSLLVVVRAADRAGHASPDRAVLAAAASAVLGNLVLFVRCPLDAPLHLLFGHATVGICLAIGYRAARRRK